MAEKNEAVDPFAELVDEVVVLEGVIGPENKLLRVVPKPRDARVFMEIGKNATDKNYEKMEETIVELIHRAYPTSNKKNIEKFFVKNYGNIFIETLVLFGFASKEDVGELRKKAKEGMVGSLKSKEES